MEDKETQSQVEAQSQNLATAPQFDEKKIAWIRLKTDLCMLPFLCLMFFWNQVDRINIGNARVYALEAELKMTGYNFNTCLSLYFVSYLIFEIPLTIACKYYGPRYFLPAATLLFGIVSFATAYVKSFAGLAGIRFCLGIAEAVIYPGCVYALTLFYTKRELVFRSGILISGALFAGAFGGLIAYGVVNNVTELAGLRTWRMLFFIEGIVTIVAALMCFVGYRDRPESAWFLTQEEKELRRQHLAYHASLGLVAVDNTTKWPMVKQGIFNINTLLIGTIALLNSIIFQGIVVFLPTIISALYPTDRPVIKNLRSVPPYLAALVVMLVVTYSSTKLGGYRGFFGLFLLGPFHIIGYALFLGASSANGKYAGAFFILAGTNIAAIGVAWIAANVAPDAGRAAGIAGVIVLQNIGGLCSTWTYLPSAAPQFTAGNSVNLAFGVTITLLCAATLLYQRHENRLRDQGVRDHRLEGKTEQEIAQLGHLDPNFRYSY